MITYSIAGILAIIGICLIAYAKITDRSENWDALFWGIVGIAALACGVITAGINAAVRCFL